MDMVEAGEEARRLKHTETRGVAKLLLGGVQLPGWPLIKKSPAQEEGIGLVAEWLGPEGAGPNLTPATYRPDSGGGSRELLPPRSPPLHHRRAQERVTQ